MPSSGGNGCWASTWGWGEERNQVCPSPHDYRITAQCFGWNLRSSDSSHVHEGGPVFMCPQLAAWRGWSCGSPHPHPGRGGRKGKPTCFGPSSVSPEFPDGPSSTTPRAGFSSQIPPVWWVPGGRRSHLPVRRGLWEPSPGKI